MTAALTASPPLLYAPDLIPRPVYGRIVPLSLSWYLKAHTHAHGLDNGRAPGRYAFCHDQDKNSRVHSKVSLRQLWEI